MPRNTDGDYEFDDELATYTRKFAPVPEGAVTSGENSAEPISVHPLCILLLRRGRLKEDPQGRLNAVDEFLVSAQCNVPETHSATLELSPQLQFSNVQV